MIKSRRNIDYFFSKAFFIRIAWMPERSLKIVCWCEGMQDLAILKMRHFYCNINSIRFMKILSTNCFVENRHVARGDEKSANHLSFWKNFVEKLKVYWKKSWQSKEMRKEKIDENEIATCQIYYSTRVFCRI